MNITRKYITRRALTVLCPKKNLCGLAGCKSAVQGVVRGFYQACPAAFVQGMSGLVSIRMPSTIAIFQQLDNFLSFLYLSYAFSRRTGILRHTTWDGKGREV